MFNLLLVLVAFAGLGLFLASKLKREGNVMLFPMGKSQQIISLLVGIVALLSSLSCVIINSDERGLKFTLGKIEEVELAPGLHFKIPFFQSIETVTIRPILLDKKVEVTAEGAITKDNQTIGAQLSVYYTYNQGSLVSMYKNIGQEKMTSILNDTIKESFKTEIGKYDIFALPTSQDGIQSKTLAQIRGKASAYPITVTELKITNYDWSDEFDTQIKTTMEKAQQVKQKGQELLIEEQEAQKQVKQAEAQKTSAVTKAEGERDAARLGAEALELKGQGIKKYNEALKQNIDLEVQLRKLEIEKIRAEKWNGQYVPTNNYGPIPVQTGGILPSNQ